MPKHVLASACACALWFGASASGCSCQGIVVEVALDTIKIDQYGFVLTILVSSDLQTNTEPTSGLNIIFHTRLKDLRKGDKVDLDCHTEGGKYVCTGISLCPPDDSGIVTGLEKYTISIRNDKGVTTVYRVKKELAENSYDHYSPLYPSRFSEVKLGARVEVGGYKENGEMVIVELDVKKDK